MKKFDFKAKYMNKQPFYLMSTLLVAFSEMAHVLQLPSEVLMRHCDTVVKYSLPCVSYRSFKMLKILASEFDTVNVHR